MFVKVVFFGFLLSSFFKTAEAAVPAVVVSTAPLHSVVSAVMEGGGRPELLLPPAVSVHDLHLKPSDFRKLSQADIVFWGGSALEAGLEKALNAVGKTEQSVSVLADSRLTVLPAREGGHHHHDQDHDDDDDKTDGHYWLMPENMMAAAEIAAEKLSAVDPENATVYKKNAERVKAEIETLKKNGQKALNPLKGKPYVVFHDAYQYFEKSFGLTPVGALFVDPHHAAGAGRISGVREKIRRSGTVCLFSEPQFSDKKGKAAAEGLSVSFGELDPSGALLTAGKAFYFELMDNLIRSFANCLSGLSEKKENIE